MRKLLGFLFQVGLTVAWFAGAFDPEPGAVAALSPILTFLLGAGGIADFLNILGLNNARQERRDAAVDEFEKFLGSTGLFNVDESGAVTLSDQSIINRPGFILDGAQVGLGGIGGTPGKPVVPGHPALLGGTDEPIDLTGLRGPTTQDILGDVGIGGGQTSIVDDIANRLSGTTKPFDDIASAISGMIGDNEGRIGDLDANFQTILTRGVSNQDALSLSIADSITGLKGIYGDSLGDIIAEGDQAVAEQGGFRVGLDQGLDLLDLEDPTLKTAEEFAGLRSASNAQEQQLFNEAATGGFTAATSLGADPFAAFGEAQDVSRNFRFNALAQNRGEALQRESSRRASNADLKNTRIAENQRTNNAIDQAIAAIRGTQLGEQGALGRQLSGDVTSLSDTGARGLVDIFGDTESSLDANQGRIGEILGINESLIGRGAANAGDLANLLSDNEQFGINFAGDITQNETNRRGAEDESIRNFVTQQQQVALQTGELDLQRITVGISAMLEKLGIQIGDDVIVQSIMSLISQGIGASREGIAPSSVFGAPQGASIDFGGGGGGGVGV